MPKYSKEIVNNYINGLDIEEYNIEELEDDPQFMILVVNETNDKNIYNLCSENVKKDYNFIKYMVTKFIDDLDFICQITDYYIQNVKDDQNLTELIILICEHTKNKNKEKYDKYKIYRHVIYIDKKVQISKTIQEIKEEDKSLTEEIGMGFFFIYDYYQHSNITLKYFAQKFITDIFEENNINLEDLIHNNFTNFEELEKYGIKKYLIDLIYKYDHYLSSYITVNTKLLNNLIMETKKIKKNWDKYLIEKEKLQYQTMIEKVEEYLKEIIFILSKDSILYYLGKNLGIEDKIRKYINLDEEKYQILISNTEFLINVTNFNLEDINHFINIEKIMIESLELDLSQNEKNKHNQKILKLIYDKK